MTSLDPLARAVKEGEDGEVVTLVQRALANGVAPETIVDRGLISGMVKVGELFKEGELFLPEVLMAAKAMSTGIDLLKPHLEGGHRATRGRVVLGTVQGDIHDIGKNIVGIMLKGAGFEVSDLGTDVSPAEFVRAAIEDNAQVIGMSALLTTTMLSMGETIEALKGAVPPRAFKVLIGGAPVTSDFAREIGADGYAPDAMTAVEMCNRWMTDR